MLQNTAFGNMLSEGGMGGMDLMSIGSGSENGDG